MRVSVLLVSHRMGGTACVDEILVLERRRRQVLLARWERYWRLLQIHQPHSLARDHSS